MSFDLRIQFFGLALFVPEKRERVHVLLPVHGDMGDGKGRHYARLVYDLAYEDQSSTELSRRFKFVNLERRVLELLPLSANPLDPHIPSEIYHLGNIADPVDPALVQGTPRGAVMSRVTVGSGALTYHQMGAMYSLQADRVRMAARSEWTIRGIESDTLSLSSLLSDPTGQSEPLPLHPLNQTIHVTIYNSLAGDMPPSGDYNPGEAPHASEHFHAYYQICHPRSAHADPQPAGETQVLVYGDVPLEGGKESGGLTCVHAQASLAQA